jgi:peroxiredoxin
MENSMPLAVGTKAPDFDVIDLQNRRIQLSASLDAPVALVFFNIRCPWCHTAIPRLASAFRRQREVGLHVLALSTDGADAATVEKWATEHELDVSIARDEGARIAAEYNITRVPSVVFIDKEGNVSAVYEGASEQLAAIVESTMLALARDADMPGYALVGNGCAP